MLLCTLSISLIFLYKPAIDGYRAIYLDSRPHNSLNFRPLIVFNDNTLKLFVHTYIIILFYMLVINESKQKHGWKGKKLELPVQNSMGKQMIRSANLREI